MNLTVLFAQQDPISMLLPFLILAALIYFFGIRPVSQQKKKQEALHNSIAVGDEVVTIGAWKGVVIAADEEGYTLRLSPDTTAYILKAGIARRIIKDTDLVNEGWEDEVEESEANEVDETEVAKTDGSDHPDQK